MRRIVTVAAMLLGTASADVHDDVTSRVRFNETFTRTINTDVGDIDIAYNGVSFGSSDRQSYASRMYFSHVQGAADLIDDFATYRGITLQRCKDRDIRAFDVGPSVLEDERLHRLVNWNDPELAGGWGQQMTGLYTPSDDDSNRATIYTDMYHPERSRIITHEVAHFLYDEFCLERARIDPERFAHDFEDYYESHIMPSRRISY
jgi:hypothetical protein